MVHEQHVGIVDDRSEQACAPRAALASLMASRTPWTC